MANDKFDDLEEGFKSEVSDSAVRARNRTVMLTPEITGQVRARLSRDNDLEERGSGVFSLPQAENEFVATRDQSSHDNDSNGHGEDAPAETSISSRLSGKNGFNPISRETHQIPVAASRKTSTSPLDMYQPQSVAPQRREAIALESHSERPQEIESSLPYIRDEQPKPAFDEDNSKSEQEETTEDVLVWSKITPVVGFLVSFDFDPNGQVFFIRSGRAIVSSQVPSGGNYLLLKDESVSPMHAIIRVTEDAQIQVLDNLSEYGTTIVRPETGEEISLSGDKAMVKHGDLMRFGKRSFSVCLIGR